MSGTGCIPEPPVIVATVTVTLATNPPLTATAAPTAPLGDWSTTLSVPPTVPACTYALTAECTLSPLGDFAFDRLLPPRVPYLANSFTLTEPVRVAATAPPIGTGFLGPAVPVFAVPSCTG
ncbi:MAG: hypothetical protein M3N31_03055 [Actinomycetota bacterium]|nr:hypothetical protein [Actinomycetota bacterium]